MKTYFGCQDSFNRPIDGLDDCRAVLATLRYFLSEIPNLQHFQRPHSGPDPIVGLETILDAVSQGIERAGRDMAEEIETLKADQKPALNLDRVATDSKLPQKAKAQTRPQAQPDKPDIDPEAIRAAIELLQGAAANLSPIQDGKAASA